MNILINNVLISIVSVYCTTTVSTDDPYQEAGHYSVTVLELYRNDIKFFNKLCE